MGVLGIALGTTDSAAYFYDGRTCPRVILPREGIHIMGDKHFPPYVEFDQAGEELYVGNRAYDDWCAGITNPVVWGSKRLIGISFREARREFRHLDYPINEREDGGIVIPVRQHLYTPEDIVTMILCKIRGDAALPFNGAGETTQVVIGFPAYFDGPRREAMRRAARAAFSGLPEYAIRLISEPVAVALSYGTELPPGEMELVCIIDLSAGTLDIVIAVLIGGRDGRLDIMPDLALGNAAFGGIDIDSLLLDWVIREYDFTDLQRVRRLGGEILEDDIVLYQELRRLRSDIEKAKIKLSHPKISRQGIVVSYKGNVAVVDLTKEKLEEIMDAPLPRERVDEFLGYSLSDEEMSKVQEALREFHPGEERELPSLLDILRLTIKNSLAKGGYKVEDIDHVLLVGGPMHMPCIRKAIRQVFAANEAVVEELERIEQEGFPVNINAVDCVARGASLYSYREDDEDESPPEDTLNFYYALVTDEEEGKDGRTYVYYDDESWLKRGDIVPCQRKVKRQAIRTGSEGGEIPITLLQGVLDTAVPDSKRLIWKKITTHSFTPVYDSEGVAHYTVTLDVDKNQIVNCIVEDQTSGERYSFAQLSRQLGETLEPKEYVVLPEPPPHGVTVGMLRGLLRFLDLLSSLVTARLMPDDDATENEKLCARMKELSLVVQLHRSEVDSVIKKYEGYSDDHAITDKMDKAIFYQVAQECLQFFPPRVSV